MNMQLNRWICSSTGEYAAQQVNMQLNRWICSSTGEYAAQQVNMKLNRWICRSTGDYACQQVNMQLNRWICSSTGEYAAQQVNMQLNRWTCSSTGEYAAQQVNMLLNRWKLLNTVLWRISNLNLLPNAGKRTKYSSKPSGVSAVKDLILLYPSMIKMLSYTALTGEFSEMERMFQMFFEPIVTIMTSGKYHHCNRSLPSCQISKGREGCRLWGNPTWNA